MLSRTAAAAQRSSMHASTAARRFASSASASASSSAAAAVSSTIRVTPEAIAAATPVVDPVAAAAAAASARRSFYATHKPTTFVRGAASLPLRLQRLVRDIPTNSKPKQNPRTGYWNAPKLNAQSLARLRKTDLMHGGVAAQFERVHLRRVEPVVLKGHKREKEIIERKKRIVAAMVDMESRIEDHHKAERARRVRPTFFQLITGKKPSGVIAAEEAAIKERKEKAKAAEKARQAKQTA